MLLTLAAAISNPLDSWQPTVLATLALFGPLVAFVVIIAFTIDARRATAWVAMVLTAASAGCALLMLAIELKHPMHAERNLTYLQFFTGGAGDTIQFKLEWGVVADPLSATVLVIVTAVSLLVQVYSRAFMRQDDEIIRYYAVMTLFTFAVAGVVLSTNYFELYFFWELIGVCSYLLIGHWWRRPEAAAAARKAFILTRLGDLGLLVGILYIFYRFGELNFDRLAPVYAAGKVGTFGLMIMALLVFAGAVGKAAQVPLHVWLLDAMEAPIPAAALIQAGTVSVAGVYLVARTYALLHASPRALLVVAFVGAGTAVLAALWALAEDDIRRVTAYSTISQAGLMMLALGVGAFGVALFQLFTHAWFKALLVLGVGAVVQTLRTNNLWEMGGLWRRLPATAWAMLIATAAAAGLPPLSGFWSQQAIVSETAHFGNRALTGLALAASFLGALFLFRMFFAVFFGELARRRRFDPDKIREPGSTMRTPMVLLGLLTAVAGAAWLPGAPRTFGTYIAFPGTGTAQPLDQSIVALSTGLALAGLLIAWVFYGGRLVSPAAMARLGLVRTVVQRGFFIDTVYRRGLAFVVLLLGRGIEWIDRRVIDGFLDGFAESLLALGRLARRIEGARVQRYALGLLAGVLAMAVLVAAVGLPAARRLLGGS